MSFPFPFPVLISFFRPFSLKRMGKGERSELAEFPEKKKRKFIFKSEEN